MYLTESVLSQGSASNSNITLSDTLSDNRGSHDSAGASSNEYVSINDGIIVPQPSIGLRNVAFNPDQTHGSVVTPPLPVPRDTENVILNSVGGAGDRVDDVTVPVSPHMSDVVMDVMELDKIKSENREIDDEITRMIEDEKSKDNKTTSSAAQITESSTSRDQITEVTSSSGKTVSMSKNLV